MTNNPTQVEPVEGLAEDDLPARLRELGVRLRTDAELLVCQAAYHITQQAEEVARLNLLADEQARYANVKKDECAQLREALAAEDAYWAASWALAATLPRLREPARVAFEAATSRRDRARAALNEQPGGEG